MRLISAYGLVDAPRILYELLRERSTEPDSYVNISHRELPSEAEHMQFFLSRPYRLWEIIEHNGKFVGYLSATDRNEIGIVLFRRFRGEGLGKAALSMFLECFKPEPAIASKVSAKWLANINPKNTASIALFEKAGFKHIQNTYAFGKP